jgi:hypothetical protein
MEEDGHDVYFHGLFAAPEGKDKSDLRRIYQAVINANDEWCYDDITAALEAEGFVRLEADRFYETEAY